MDVAGVEDAEVWVVEADADGAWEVACVEEFAIDAGAAEFEAAAWAWVAPAAETVVDFAVGEERGFSDAVLMTLQLLWSMVSVISAVSGVMTARASGWRRMRTGSEPMWSRWAWVMMTASRRAWPRREKSGRASKPFPFGCMPESRRMRDRPSSRR